MIGDSVAGAMLDASPDGVLLVRADGSIAFANSAASELFGHERVDLSAMLVEDLMPSDVRDSHVLRRNSYNAEPSSRPMDTGLQLFAERGDAALIPVEISLSPVTVDDEVCTIVTVRDVSERRETIAKVALLSERERIARDIHDMVIQRLFAAGMSLQAVVGMAEPPMVSERVSSVVGELDDTIRELRSAIFQLGVPDARQSLVAHLAAVVDARTKHLGFTPELRIIGDIDTVPDFVGEQLIATVTESLSNVARHANATASEVTVVLDDGALRLTVSDNGVGIAGSPKPNGGLSNIVWRATELGGSCLVQAGSPTGTVISWHVPV
jgi:two-component system sensor histidine kinase DevS